MMATTYVSNKAEMIKAMGLASDGPVMIKVEGTHFELLLTGPAGDDQYHRNLKVRTNRVKRSAQKLWR